ncbi:dephospho-CoA kinase [Pyrococcus furiosus DSM 3638]|uniref:UPF0200 protein PF1294 n=3 Tax=Pyrococcus furiosus TaxID=2261 RepID=Y1294_PYRFU|nr:dephospho-CoA kinase [Pyrococcus furiosus]P58833.1 RecName: Full=UPF0200 protein PF1294 [Pyrococcus furiosus DSM 3638]AAL81418.1 hypothetical protein PF1294 [Pyrococcus furiosus DSM 3638]AFN04078.1 hypothetical protein PFC_05685 [Pyrococcus furiosus COM1]QEK78935.1 dephospho-CoA kinase [Pyrococcus furiosus DSM 3638]
MILLLTGMPGSGKGVVAREFEKRGIPVVSMGDAIREEAEKRGIPKTPEGLKEVSLKVREELGPGAVAILTVPKVRKLLELNPVVVVEGVRSPYEVEEFRKEFKNEEIKVVAIHSSPKSRFQRLLKRQRSDDPKTWEEFVERDRKELNFGIGEVIALADYIIVNECGFDQLKANIEKLISMIFDGKI